MKGVILAGGTGSRLYPLTRVTNKALLPMGEVPIIVHILNVFLKAGITDIMLVTGTEHVGAIMSLLGSGSEYGCQMTYRVQDNANGIAAALGLCENFVGQDRFAVILGDNIFENVDDVAADIAFFAQDKKTDFGLFVKELPDAKRFGVAKYGVDGGLEDIVEKPDVLPSSDAVLGLYLYSADVFQIIKRLRPSARGEYEISDVNSAYVKSAFHTGHVFRVEDGWVDAGTHESYQRATEMMRNRAFKEDIDLISKVTKEFK